MTKHNKLNRFLLILLTLALLLPLVSCTASNDGGNETVWQTETVFETAEESEAVTDEVSAYPVTVTDQAGRSVTIEKAPEKVVSGYYISTSLLIALDLDSLLVGIEAKADKRDIYRLAAPELIELPSVGTAKEFDTEGCISLEPDVVILPLKLKSIAETLEDLGIKVIFVNPEDRDSLHEMTNTVAKIFCAEKRAAKLFDFWDKVEKELAYSVKDKALPTVYLCGNSSLLSTAGEAMYQSHMISMAGGENVAKSLTDTYWAQTDYEQILAWDPEYMVIASDAVYTVEDVLNDANLSACRAVKDGKVVKLPGKAEAWDSPVPSSILGSLWLASVLHPDSVTMSRAEELTDEFYSTFYGFKYSEN